MEVKLGRHEGLRRDCVVNCDWLVTIPKDDLVARAGALGGAKLARLDSGLLIVASSSRTLHLTIDSESSFRRRTKI
jgi:mRNA-degrading endonuclease toxin of MazEF toxin-antitoxin module